MTATNISEIERSIQTSELFALRKTPYPETSISIVRNCGKSSPRNVTNRDLRPSYSSSRHFKIPGALGQEMINHSGSYIVGKFDSMCGSFPPEIGVSFRARLRHCDSLISEKERIQKPHPESQMSLLASLSLLTLGSIMSIFQ
jgi:hypothetical protein